MLPGSRRLVLKLRELDRRVAFLSNNPTRDPGMYAEKLTKRGLETSAGEIVNPVVTMTRRLLHSHPDAAVFPIAEEPQKDALPGAGIGMSEDPAQIDMVVASYDLSFDHRKLRIAFDAIWFHGRAMLATTSADRYCPLPGGRGEPDATAIVGAIEGGVRRCEVRGQSRQGPDPIMLDTIMGGRGLETEDCVMSGEGLYTDVRMALDAGMPSAVVLTDDTKAGDLRNDPQNTSEYVQERIDHLIPTDLRADLRADLGWGDD